MSKTKSLWDGMHSNLNEIENEKHYYSNSMKKTLTLAIDPSRTKSSFYLMLWEYFIADGSVIINLRTFERIILQEWEIFSNDEYVDWTCRFSKALKTWMMQSSPIL